MNIYQIQKNHEAAGMFFFSPDSMRFFHSRVHGEVYSKDGNHYFVTSERCEGERPRLFTVRMYNEKTHGITTIGEFQEHPSSAAAVRAIQWDCVGEEYEVLREGEILGLLDFPSGELSAKSVLTGLRDAEYLPEDSKGALGVTHTALDTYTVHRRGSINKVVISIRRVGQ